MAKCSELGQAWPFESLVPLEELLKHCEASLAGWSSCAIYMSHRPRRDGHVLHSLGVGPRKIFQETWAKKRKSDGKRAFSLSVRSRCPSRKAKVSDWAMVPLGTSLQPNQVWRFDAGPRLIHRSVHNSSCSRALSPFLFGSGRVSQVQV